MIALELIAELMSESGQTDPYPVYERLRELGPVVTAQPGYAVATSYTAVDALLRDPHMLVEPTVLGGKDSLLNLNPPDHTRVRRLVAGAFTPKRINGLERAIAAQAEALIQAMRDNGTEADLMQDFAYQLPVGVICELLGVPAKDRAWFRPLASDISILLDGTGDELGMQAAASANDLLRAYFADLVRARRGTPQNDLISELAHAEALSEEEVLGNLALLLIAGFETTTNLIGNGVAALLARPDQLARLAVDPWLAPAFVEEFLRFDAPVQVTSRIAGEHTVLEGQSIDRGAYVMALIGSANRDPARFAHADTFDPDRPSNTPVSFGAGPHFCLGAALARLEARVAFPVLLRGLPGLGAGGPPVRRLRIVLRGYDCFPIRWEARLT